jgi:hypothetical protein
MLNVTEILVPQTYFRGEFLELDSICQTRNGSDNGMIIPEDTCLRLMASAYVNSAFLAEATKGKPPTTAGQIGAARRSEDRME